MLWMIAILLIELWVLKLVTSYPTREFINIFLVVGVIMVLVRMMLRDRML